MASQFGPLRLEFLLGRGDRTLFGDIDRERKMTCEGRQTRATPIEDIQRFLHQRHGSRHRRIACAHEFFIANDRHDIFHRTNLTAGMFVPRRTRSRSTRSAGIVERGVSEVLYRYPMVD
ncbi:hypothetical protein [Sphingomonas sp. Ant H11]|uniref:hypothetical protein n=1 Tax=Sphingomonas sp. Ant H11 TaxID=1564113 RepID=UPI0012E06320|nr:hypothetical protein [Sphingomonas sp. Ant H11]